MQHKKVRIIKNGGDINARELMEMIKKAGSNPVEIEVRLMVKYDDNEWTTSTMVNLIIEKTEGNKCWIRLVGHPTTSDALRYEYIGWTNDGISLNDRTMSNPVNILYGWNDSRTLRGYMSKVAHRM